MLQYIRKSLYLKHNTDLQDILKKYIVLMRAGYRTPLGDLEYATNEINLQIEDYNSNNTTISKYIKT